MTWRRLLILDLALLAVLVAGAVRVRRSWQEFQRTHRVELVRADADPIRTIAGPVAVVAASEDWTEISVKNPFSFDRNDVPIVAPTQAAPVTGKPVLFGVMSVGSEKIAMLGPAQSGRASRPVKVGDSVDNWQVAEIGDRSVVVTAANGMRQTVIMNDPTVQQARSMERTGTGAPSVGSVVNAPASGAPAAATTNSANSAASAPTAQQPNQPASNDEILITPFGPVKRTKP